MFLKSLEIRGFKSFADKTELKFNGGITAIVGPNGSGKSNISDAVRWVLGEQSVKTLRGSKMEDVIFTGTEFRKPVGLAQVSLTLDNSTGDLPIDYHDVKVTRRVFRSGESEYLINNSQCRLKDITTLFMDTGIGKEGYSLIGQGKIDAILNGKPEDRRALLEEAAGIVKFKSRKNEAERKLENTKDNLVRINDIIHTYEERLVPLEVEKNKALEYMEFASKLRNEEISLIVNNLIKLEKEISEQKNKIDNLNNINIKRKEEYKSKREELLILKKALDDLEHNHNEEQKTYFNKKENISRSLSEIQLLRERINNINESISKSEIEINESNTKITKLEEEKGSLEIEYRKNNQIYKEFNDKILFIDSNLKELTRDLEQRNIELNNVKDNEFQILSDISNLKNKRVVIDTQLKSFVEKVKQLEESRNIFQNNIKINLATKVNLEKEILVIESKKQELIDLMRVKSLEKNNVESCVKDFQSKLNKASAELHRLEGNKDLLTKLEQQYEGYNISVKKIMQSINNGKLTIDKSKCIVFGEAIKTNKGYETAIEITSGAAISNIITEDEETAKYLINYLKNNKIGRATFLPLSTIKANKLSLDKNITNIKGYLGIASDLVQYEEKYESAVNYILGKTIICDNIDNALLLAKKINYRHRIVTLLGEVVNAGGALTGGSIQQRNMGIISRKTEFKELEIKIQSVKKHKDELSTSLNDSIKNNQELDKQKESLKEQVYTKKLELADIKNKINNIDENVVSIKTNFKTTEIELKSFNERITDGENQLNKIIVKITELENVGHSNSEKLQEINEIIKTNSEELTLIREQSTELKVKRAQIEEFVDNKIKELDRNTIALDEVKNKIISLTEYVNKSILTKKESTSKIDTNESIINNEKTEVLILEEKEKLYEVERGKAKEKIEVLESSLEDITIEIAKRDDEVHRNEIVYTKQENEKNIYHSRLRDEYNTTFEEEGEKFIPITNIDSHKQLVNKLKSKISSLGAVNVNAIEEFKDVFEKYNFMTVEKEDLEKAQEELVNVIEEMTCKMRVVFRQNFHILNQLFDETFKELFKGGNGKLKLDEGDELTGNIEINVQPPGKKIQNINLMSGGEKVLSAIALLFAILKMKPTPFCILDEIEAALDDANVNRYSEFLQKFSGNIQFIIITHRKGTMEAADVMYGVTMEEKGVSKVVSVDLA